MSLVLINSQIMPSKKNHNLNGKQGNRNDMNSQIMYSIPSQTGLLTMYNFPHTFLNSQFISLHQTQHSAAIN